MQSYVSYEQVVSAAVACYKEYITSTELIKLINELKGTYPNMVIANDKIRATKNIIYCISGSALLNPDYTIDTNIFVRGHAMTIKDYLCKYAGKELVDFMENKKTLEESEKPQR